MANDQRASDPNQVRINDKDTRVIGIQKIIVGVPTKEQDEHGNPVREIIVNDRGLNEARTKVEPKEIYNFRKQTRHQWFMLALETGRGINPETGYPNSWFPGCKIKGDVLQAAELKAEPREDSQTLEIIEAHTTVEIRDLPDIPKANQAPATLYEGWYKVLNINEGYLKIEEVSNLHYE